jgi:hypothetical protein
VGALRGFSFLLSSCFSYGWLFKLHYCTTGQTVGWMSKAPCHVEEVTVPWYVAPILWGKVSMDKWMWEGHLERQMGDRNVTSAGSACPDAHAISQSTSYLNKNLKWTFWYINSEV